MVTHRDAIQKDPAITGGRGLCVYEKEGDIGDQLRVVSGYSCPGETPPGGHRCPIITSIILHHRILIMQEESGLEQATFAAGCFWGVEAAFRRVESVVRTWTGYTGGTVQYPTYKQICSGSTGHAEAVRVEFDPRVVTYDQLLEVFWDIHDPTQENRQGPDIGTNYRSAIFYHSNDQKEKALASRDRVQGSPRLKGRKVVTEILPAGPFWKAEDCHQQFYEKCGWGYAAGPKYWG